MTPYSKAQRKQKFHTFAKIPLIFIAITATLVVAAAVHTIEMPADKKANQGTLSQKIETYKKFKEKYEDKDFELSSYPVSRSRHVRGEIKSHSFDVYHITYGIVADNIKEYDKRRNRLFRTRPSGNPGCRRTA